MSNWKEATSLDYTATADELTKRIVKLGPQILTFDDPWKLFKIDGFTCNDLEPTYAQACFALAKAQEIVKEESSR